MSRTLIKGPKLPATLLDRLGSANNDGASGSLGRRSMGRKEQRKAVREQRKQQRRPQSRPQLRPRHARYAQVEADSETEDDQVVEVQPRLQPVEKNPGPVETPKLILKKVKRLKDIRPEPAAQPRLSSAVKAKLEADDAEIAALEKKLGLKKRKTLPKAFDDDGLGGLLDDLDEHVDGMNGKRKRSDYDEFLFSKRRHVKLPREVSEDDEEDEEDLGSDDEIEADVGSVGVENFGSNGERDSELVEEEDDFSGFDDVENNEFRKRLGNSDSEKSVHVDEMPTPTKKRENPYIASVVASVLPTGKYVPPSMRGSAISRGEDMTRLRRQLQGLLNKLSDANMNGILREVEAAYSNNARQHVTTMLIDLLMGLLCDRAPLMDTFIILHAGFSAGLYKVAGAHFGAQLLERIVSDFDRLYDVEKAAVSGSKETTNLIALLAELYTFQLVGSNLVFDYIRLFLADLSELNAELLLKVIKSCGSQLRHDDPSSLKDIVILLQNSVAKVGEANLPVRTKFMIETINNLKNNRQKTGVLASSVAAEHTTRMKKTLGTLNARAKTSEPLNVSLKDIKSSDKEGKWWLVGASWKNDAQALSASTEDAREMRGDVHREGTTNSADLLLLAKEQRMNTDIRRAIFMNIMSASDYKDAHVRLTKLKLKKAQELEIPRVLIHCASAEQGYNPYYTLIAKRLCTEHRFKWAMQYGLWDLFKRMGENNDDSEDSDADLDDGEDGGLDLRKIVNLGRMYGQLVADDAMSLTSLKVLNFAYLQSKTKTFLEILLTTAFIQLIKRSKENDTSLDSAITALLMQARDTPQVIRGLHFFFSKQVNPEELGSSSAERKVLRKAVKAARLVLTQLSTSLS